MDTRQCRNCNTVLHHHAQFCGHCGSAVYDIPVDTLLKPIYEIDPARQVITNPPLQGEPSLHTPPPAGQTFIETMIANPAQRSGDGRVQPEQRSEDEEEEEKKRRVFPFFPWSGHQPGSQAPLAQGTPSIGGPPMVQGTPQVMGNLSHIGEGPSHVQPTVARGISHPGQNLARVDHLPYHHGPHGVLSPAHPTLPPNVSYSPPATLPHPPMGNPPGLGNPAHSQLPQSSAKGCSSLRYALLASLAVLLLGVIGALLAPFLVTYGASQPQLAITNTSGLYPGGMITVSGNHFHPGGTVTFSVNGIAITQLASNALKQRSLMMGMQLTQIQQSSFASGAATVGSNGTFEAKIKLPLTLQESRTYTILATEKQNQRTTAVSIKVNAPRVLTPTPQTTVTPSQTPTRLPNADLDVLSPETVVFPATTEGYRSVPDQQVTLKTTGDGPVQWTSTIDQSPQWLQADASGQVNAPESGTLLLHVLSGLTAGDYTATLHVTNPQSGTGRDVQVSLTVKSNKTQSSPPELSSVKPGKVDFGTVSTANTQSVSKKVQLTTVGIGTVSWKASWDTGASWLELDKSGSMTAPKSATITLVGSGKGLDTGEHSTTVTFTSQTGKTVVLEVSIKLVASCMNTSNTDKPMSFSAVVNAGDPAPQTLTITNCSAAAEPWAVSVSTDDKGKWLTVKDSSGNIDANASQTITVSVSQSGLTSGSYTGYLYFYSDTEWGVVKVSLTVGTLATLSVNTNVVNSYYCQNSSNSTAIRNCQVTLKNTSDNFNVDWTSSVSDSRTVGLSQYSGTLAAGESISITISIVAGYDGTVTFSCINNSQNVQLAYKTPPIH